MNNDSIKVNNLNSSQRLLLALKEAKTKLEAMERSKNEPIAIVGMSCRFPGGANNPEEFWQILANGVDAITSVPAERWDIDAYYDSDPDIPGKMYARYGGFLQQLDIDKFDAHFFGISPREASKIDPQQRLLLELSWEALEKAGIINNSDFLSQTGVFVGATTNDYASLIMPEGNLDQIDAYYLTGNPLNAMAGRLSYTLGLNGPCMAVDTACSSSLVAVHLACQSLRNQECSHALAGGVNLILSPENTVGLSKAKMLSPDGRCKTFDADANGIVRGEGCGVLVLKRLSDAVADGNDILAVIRGSAVNQDGSSSGFTVPNKTAQENLIRQALRKAKVDPNQIDYVEAHGTGTSLGDPIEIRALASALGGKRSPEQHLKVGSVKTNIGHLESAAGIASLIKVVLALQHQEIPPHLHLKQLNPYVNWDESAVSVVTEALPWKIGEKSRMAGISSFGASGTNAHVILEEASLKPEIENTEQYNQPPLCLLTISAKTKEALNQLANSYEKYISQSPALNITDICFASNTERRHFNNRVSILASSTKELLQKLAAFTSSEETPGIIYPQSGATTAPKIAFLFTGQGSQYINMGRQLYETQSTFRKILDECSEILSPYLEKPLLEVIYPQTEKSSNSNLIDETAYTQPALFALEYALYQLWKSWGIEPTAVLGHSVGEYVAACVCGVFSLSDGLKLIATRGRLMQSLPQEGEMLAILGESSLVNQILQNYSPQDVTIAAINAPNSLVISGRREIVQAINQTLTTQGVKTKLLQVSHAFHSPLMKPMLAEFRKVASEITYSKPKLKLISNLTGKSVGAEITNPDYWCRHIVDSVKFADSIKTLHQEGYEAFVEIGPKPILLGMSRHSLPETGQLLLPSLRPGQEEDPHSSGEWQQLLQSLGKLYVRGVSVDWTGFWKDYQHKHISLPTYPFQRQRYWVKSNKSKSIPKLLRDYSNSNIVHPLLGEQLHLAGKEIYFQSIINRNSPDFLADHCIYQTAILPATAYLEMALAAGAAVFKSDNLLLENVAIKRAIIFSDDEDKTLQLILKPEATTSYEFNLFSLVKDDNQQENWVLHASGKIRKNDINSDSPQIDLESIQAQCSEEISATNYYQDLRERGFDYGSCFQGIAGIWKGEKQTLGKIQLPAELAGNAEKYQLHPVLLDACFQILGTNFPTGKGESAYLPVEVERLQVYRRYHSRLWSKVEKFQVKDANQKHVTADLGLYDEAGNLVASLQGLSFRRTPRKIFERKVQKDLQEFLYQTVWEAQIIETQNQLVQNQQSGSWLIFADKNGAGLKLAQGLENRGERCVIVSAGSVYEQLQQHHYQIDFSQPEDIVRLLAEAFEESHSPCRGIVHMWSLDAGLADEVEAVREAQIKGCGSVLHLTQALAQVKWSYHPQLWLITKGSQSVKSESTPLQVEYSSLWGLGRVINLEHPELRCSCLDLDPLGGDENISALSAELLADSKENQVAYRQGIRYISRLERYRSQPEVSQNQLKIPHKEPFQLQITKYGILENLTLKPMKRTQPAAGEVEIQVCAVGLNFRDVLNALGMLEQYTKEMGIASAKDLPFGGECAGRVVAVGENVTHLKVGDEVIAAQTIGSLASFVNVPAEFVVIKPQQLSFAEAATIPTAFLTAYYGLHRQANLKSKERVLIHAAAGGVGQAAVQLAQRLDAEILATASPPKWDFLKSMGIKQVMNSRNLEFAEQVMETTGSEGVDVVLNSLNGEYIDKNLEVLGKNSRFVEIGKIGIWDKEQVKATRNDVAYYPFDLLEISMQNPGLIASMLEELMEEFKQGNLKPLPHKVFPLQDIVGAFRYMAQAKHIGKVVVTIEEPSTEKNSIKADKSYLISGGLGALGLKVAGWMVEQGAKNLILLGRRELSATVQLEVDKLEQAGAKILTLKTDVSHRDEVSQMLETVKDEMLPLAGIVHAAGVLEDGMLQGQTWDSFNRVMSPKVAGSWNLHTLTKELNLDFFICFSSISALLGSPGQGNYAAANSFMDALVYHRRKLGLPGITINWGPWSDTGMAAMLNHKEQARWDARGVTRITTEMGLQVLAEVLEKDLTQVGVLPVDWSKFMQKLPGDVELPFLEKLVSPTPQNQAENSEFRKQLDSVSGKARQTLLMTHVCSQLAKVIGLNSPQEIEPQAGFSELGMDSLMSVEFRNRLQNSLGCSIPTSVAFDYPTVESLVNYLDEDLLATESEEKSAVELTKESNQETKSLVESESNLDELSDSEAEALLMKKLESMRY